MPIKTGGGILLAKRTANNSPTIDFSSELIAGFTSFKIRGWGIYGTSAGNLLARVGNGETYVDTASSHYWRHLRPESSVAASNGPSTAAALNHTDLDVPAAAGESMEVKIEIFDALDAAVNTHWFVKQVQTDGSVCEVSWGDGMRVANEINNSFRIYPASGVLVEGEFELRGIR